MYYTIPGILFIIISIIYANKHPENPYPILNIIFMLLGFLFLIVEYWDSMNIGKLVGKLLGT